MSTNYANCLSSNVKLNMDSLSYYCSIYVSYISPFVPQFINTVKSSPSTKSQIIVDPTVNIKLNSEILPDNLQTSDINIHEYIYDNSKYLNNGLNYIYDFDSKTYSDLYNIYNRLKSLNEMNYGDQNLKNFIKNFNLYPAVLDLTLIAKYYDNFIYRTNESLKNLIYNTLSRNSFTYRIDHMSEESLSNLNKLYNEYITSGEIYSSYIITIPRYGADDNLILQNSDEYIEIFDALGNLQYNNETRKYEFPPLIHKYIYPNEMKKDDNDYVWIYNSYFESAENCVMNKWKEQNLTYTIDDISEILNLIGEEYKKLFTKIIFYRDSV